MAIDSKKYEALHNKTGSDLEKIKKHFDDGDHNNLLDFPAESAIVYQMQKMQEELDYLRGIIDTNNDKATFPGFGTSGSTCLVGNTSLLALGTSSSTALAGNTTTITTAQAKAITTNTAKTGITDSQASAITANTAKVSFPVLAEEGNSLSFTVDQAALTITNTYTNPETGKKVSYSTTIKLS